MAITLGSAVSVGHANIGGISGHLSRSSRINSNGSDRENGRGSGNSNSGSSSRPYINNNSNICGNINIISLNYCCP